ncbi:Immunoglobulin E-set [Phytophthora cactorum]|nr:Immunoglobulin E-set [Phytophthora cactorum]
MSTDVDGETILHHEWLLIKRRFASQETYLSFTMPLFEPLAPLYYIKLAASVIPQAHPAAEECTPTELLDLQPLFVNNILLKLVGGKKKTAESVSIAIERCELRTHGGSNASTRPDADFAASVGVGDGKSVLARARYHEDLAFLGQPDPKGDELKYDDWNAKFGEESYWRQSVVELTGDLPQICDCLQRKRIQNQLAAFERRISWVAVSIGPTIEVVMSRMRFIAADMEKKKKAAGERAGACWLGASASEGIFNFHPNAFEDQRFFSSRMLAMAKPLYNTIANQAEKKPANDSQKFVSHSAKDKVDVAAGDGGAVTHIGNGVGYCTDTMSSRNREYVLNRFATGKIQVLIVPQSMAWELRSAQTSAFMVVIMGPVPTMAESIVTVDYQLADVFQMTKFANHAASAAVKCSQLEHFLSDHINAEIVTKQSRAARRGGLSHVDFYVPPLHEESNYYNLQGATNVHLSDHLSELVETTVNALEESRCIQVVEEEEDEENEGEERLVPLNLGMIAAYYYINLKADSKVRALLTILSSATEFSDLPSRYGEDKKLEGLAKHLKFPVAAGGDYGQAHVKTNVLLQVHFSKQHDRLSPALRQDLDFILRHAVRLLHAMVDVISSNGWLKPALAAMDLAQMVVQAQWSNPVLHEGYAQEVGEMDLEEEVETPVDILSMEDDARSTLLPLDTQKMSAVAKFCNAFPDVTVQTKVQQDGKNLPQGSAVSVKVQLEQDEEEEQDEDKELGLVNACHYPVKKAENWWVVLGDAKKNTLLSIKRVPFASARANLGAHTFQLYVICDGYAGCDLENEVKITVVEGEDTDEEEEDDEE